jgi:hypothetical protein
MTMLAHSLKPILQLVPEAMPLVKQASVDQEFPLDSKDSTLATALQLKYFEKVAYHAVDVFQLEKVAKAVDLYGLREQLNELTGKMVKAAQAKKEEVSLDDQKLEYQIKEAAFSHNFQSTKERATEATELYKQASDLGITPSEDVVRYSGHAYFDKEAALKGLTVRYNETKDLDFVKVARVIVEGKNDERLRDADNLVKLASFIDTLDKRNHLQFKGFDFFKEAFVKEAAYKSALMVKLAGQQVPYESLERVGHTRIASYIGKDVADEMNHGPENFKAVAETLPLDLQRMLVSLTKNV